MTSNTDPAPPAGRRRGWWGAAVLGLAIVAVVALAAYDSATRVPVDLATADFERLDQELAAHRGRVVVVEFWATWCGPCRVQFPRFVALARKYQDRGVVLVTVAQEKDHVADRPAALEFLSDRRAAFTNFLWTDRTPKGRAGLEGRFGHPGMIPYTALFGRDGKRVAPEEGPLFTHRELDLAIEAALAEP